MIGRTWYVAVCLGCELDLPFDSEAERDGWASAHGDFTKHVVRRRTDKRWREPVVVDQPPGSSVDRAADF